MLCEWSAIALAIDAAYGRFDAACYIGRPMPYDIRFERILQIETLSNRSRSNGSMQTTSSGHSDLNQIHSALYRPLYPAHNR